MQTTEPALEISDDKGRLDVPLIHRFLSEEAYWCLGIPLATSDAHGLYADFGFVPPRSPGSLMEIYDPEIYRRP